VTIPPRLLTQRQPQGGDEPPEEPVEPNRKADPYEAYGKQRRLKSTFVRWGGHERSAARSRRDPGTGEWRATLRLDS